jgi:hypothetical protein
VLMYLDLEIKVLPATKPQIYVGGSWPTGCNRTFVGDLIVDVKVVVHTFNMYVRAVFLDVFCVTVFFPSVKCNVASGISAELGERIDSSGINQEQSLCRDLFSVSDYLYSK